MTATSTRPWTVPVLLALALLAAGSGGAAATDLPTDSVHRLDALLTDQDGRDFRLADLRGQPVLVAMFYTSCKYICPLIVDSVRGVDHALSQAERQGLRVLLVSMDPDRDTPQALRAVVDQRRLDTGRWTLARTDAGQVRRLAAVLGVRYRALADGEFNHTSSIILLDRDGRRIATTAASGPAADPDFVAAVRAALATDPPPPPAQ
jgi:protein SCO1/2